MLAPGPAQSLVHSGSLNCAYPYCVSAPAGGLVRAGCRQVASSLELPAFLSMSRAVLLWDYVQTTGFPLQTRKQRRCRRERKGDFATLQMEKSQPDMRDLGRSGHRPVLQAGGWDIELGLKVAKQLS